MSEILKKNYLLLIKYFKDDCGYQVVPVSGIDKNNETWMINLTNGTHPIIRLSVLSTGGQHITQVHQMIGRMVQDRAPLLNLYVSDYDQEQEILPNVINARIWSDTVSNSLFQEFKHLERVFLPSYQSRIERKSQRRIKSRFTSVFGLSFTNILIIVSLILYGLQILLSQSYNRDITNIFLGALYKDLVYGAYEYHRLISAGLLHGSFIHLLSNILAFNNIGNFCEKMYTKKRMIMITFVSIISSNLAALVTSPANSYTLGLSGAVYGVFGAMIVYLHNNKLLKVPGIRNQMLGTIFINIMINFFPGVSVMGHLGGLVGGILVALAYTKFNKTLKNSAIMSLILLLICSVLLLNRDYKQQESLNGVAVVQEIIDMAEDLKLNRYAQYLDSNMYEYYFERGN